MKIYSDKLTNTDLRHALPEGVSFQDTFRRPGWYEPFRGFKPRRHFERGYEVFLSGSSRYNSAHDRYEKAATWDEWGIFIAALFEIDPEAKISHYDGRDDFIAQTREERDRIWRNFGGESHLHSTHKAPWLNTDVAARASSGAPAGAQEAPSPIDSP